MTQSRRPRQRHGRHVSRRGPVTISACLIVRNEAENLPRCLRSLRGTVDEIVVVDTGSTDGSDEVARQHGAQVFAFDWCDDFAAARNASIDRAHGEWILWLDADEELMEKSPGDLRRLCASAERPEGFLLACHNLSNALGECSSVIHQWRLFRNHLGLRFFGRIHEHLLRSDRSTNVHLLGQEAVWVRHWGYLPDPALMQRKRARNLRLLELALRDSPDDPFVHYNMGKQYVAYREFARGLPWLERSIRLWQGCGGVLHAYVGNLFALAINAAVELGDFRRAVEIEQQAPPDVLSPDILFQAGVAWMRLGRRDEARARLLRAWQDPSIRQRIEVDPSSSTWRPLAALAELELGCGNARKAHEYACEGLTHGPRLPNLLYAVALTAAKLELFAEAVEHARRLLQLDGDDGYKRKARRLLLNIGRVTGDAALVLESCSGLIEGLSEAEVAAAQAEALGAESVAASARPFPAGSGRKGPRLNLEVGAYPGAPEARRVAAVGAGAPSN